MKGKGSINELPDYKLNFIISHIIRFDLHITSVNLPVIGSESKLRDDRNTFCVDDIGQFFILWDESVIT